MQVDPPSCQPTHDNSLSHGMALLAVGVVLWVVWGYQVVGWSSVHSFFGGNRALVAEPVCLEPIEVRTQADDIENATMACAHDALYVACHAVAGDAVWWSGDVCYRQKQGMRVAWRFLTGLKISLNTATAADLLLLPGIGPKTAQKIVEQRKLSGPYASVAALRQVAGIGPQTIARLAPYLTVDP